VKTVCKFIGAQAQVDVSKHGGRNPLVDMADDIDILGGKTDAERELDAIRGPVVAERWQDDPRLAPVAANPEAGVEASNGAGSYEALLAAFGGPPPVAGRG
jgi:hypothetical protein